MTKSTKKNTKEFSRENINSKTHILLKIYNILENNIIANQSGNVENENYKKVLFLFFWFLIINLQIKK